MNRRINIFGITFLLMILTAANTTATAAEVPVSVTSGISISQLDFPTDDIPLINSSIGLLDVNAITLRGQTGINSGYINMVRNSEWVVRNLPILPEAQYPYSNLSVRFDLNVSAGTDVTSLDAIMTYSDVILNSAPNGSLTTFAVGDQTVSQGGLGTELPSNGGNASPTTVPTVTAISFGDPTNNRQIFQLDHPNIEAALNQCAPMSVANSLQFLANTTPLALPHSHVLGLKGDASLVGQLGSAMNRNAPSRTEGGGVRWDNVLKGKLKYLADNDLHERVITKHWGFFGDMNYASSNGDKSATSKGQGALHLNNVIASMEGGADCEAGYYWPTKDDQGNDTFGAHAVDLVAAGYIAGQPFVIENSDLDQSSDTKGAGKSGFLFSFLSSGDDGSLKMNGSTQQLGIVMCQTYVPVPVPTGISLPPMGEIHEISEASLEIDTVTDLAGHRGSAEDPPPLVNLTIQNGVLLMQSAGIFAPWFPISVPIAVDGSFSGTKTATVAGFADIGVSILGAFGIDGMTASFILGSNGGLPTGQPITFDVTITPSDAWPWLFEDPVPEPRPFIRINGFRNSVSLTAGEPLSVGLSMQAGTDTAAAEWWLVAESGGTFFSFDLATMSWVPGLIPTVVSEVIDIESVNVFTFLDGLPAGDYNFIFGLDATPNNNVDLESLVYDLVEVSIAAP